MRQVGASIGVAIIGTVLASSIVVNLTKNISGDAVLPDSLKPMLVSNIQNVDIASGRLDFTKAELPPQIQTAIKTDADKSIVDSAKKALVFAAFFVLLGAIVSLFIKTKNPSEEQEWGKAEA